MTTRILTQDELKEQLNYNPETGIFTRLKKVSNVKIGDIAGGIQITGYINISVNNKPYYAHRLAWLYVYGKFPSNSIDHINGIKTDNRLCNLREATKTQNSQNTGVCKSNKSGYRGVYLLKSRNRWIANSIYYGKRVRIGSYKTVEEANEAYKSFAQQHHGEFYRNT